MIVLMYATHIDGYMPVLLDQLKKKNIKYEVLGYKKKWEGFFQRTIDYYDYLKTIDNSEIICIIDGFDTLCFDNEKEILEKYEYMVRKSKKPIIWGTDMDRQVYTRKIFGAGDILINGGCSIGSVKYYKKVFEDLFQIYGTNKNQDDQKMINNYYYSHPEKSQKYICLDEKNIFFGNATYKDMIYNWINPVLFKNINEKIGYELFNYNENIDFEYDPVSKKVYHIKYLTKTSFLSGPGNVSLDKIVSQCGYEFENPRSKKYLMIFIKNFMSDIIKIIVVLVILIVIIYYVIKTFFNNKINKKIKNK